jgi:hypothetical protein
MTSDTGTRCRSLAFCTHFAGVLLRPLLALLPPDVAFRVMLRMLLCRVLAGKTQPKAQPKVLFRCIDFAVIIITPPPPPPPPPSLCVLVDCNRQLCLRFRHLLPQKSSQYTIFGCNYGGRACASTNTAGKRQDNLRKCKACRTEVRFRSFTRDICQMWSTNPPGFEDEQRFLKTKL